MIYVLALKLSKSNYFFAKPFEFKDQTFKVTRLIYLI